MKNYLILVMLFSTLISNSQTEEQSKALIHESEKFITLHNTGDTLKYQNFLKDIEMDKSEYERTYQGFKNTFNMLGKVMVFERIPNSPTNIHLLIKENNFDTWWNFMITTDEDQNFLYRRILPVPLPEIALYGNKLTPSQIKDSITSYINQRFGNEFAGNVYVKDHGQILFDDSFGNDHNGDVNTRETKFGLASASKMFTAISIFQLLDDGKLNISTEVGEILPRLKNEKIKGIKVSQLLNHTSGMGDFFENALYESEKDNLTTSESFMPFIENDTLFFEPGTEFRYSNNGFALLGLIVERLSKLSFTDYVETNILKPLNMKQTTVGTGAGGGTSTVEDMERFLEGFKDGKLLSEESNDLFFNYTTENRYGYGTEHHIIGEEHIIGHSGGFIKECVELNLYPKTDKMVIIISNSNPPFGHFLANKIKQLLLSKTHI